MKSFLIEEIAFARSGDKGLHANIALFAYEEKGYQLLLEKVTEKAVSDFFSFLTPSAVERYPVPNLLAINYVLREAFDPISLRYDAQGKALGQALLQMRILYD